MTHNSVELKPTIVRHDEELTEIQKTLCIWIPNLELESPEQSLARFSPLKQPRKKKALKLSLELYYAQMIRNSRRFIFYFISHRFMAQFT